MWGEVRLFPTLKSHLICMPCTADNRMCGLKFFIVWGHHVKRMRRNRVKTRATVERLMGCTIRDAFDDVSIPSTPRLATLFFCTFCEAAPNDCGPPAVARKCASNRVCAADDPHDPCPMGKRPFVDEMGVQRGGDHAAASQVQDRRQVGGAQGGGKGRRRLGGEGAVEGEVRGYQSEGGAAHAIRDGSGGSGGLGG